MVVNRPVRFLLHLQPILNINENIVNANLQDKVFIQGLNKVILPKVFIFIKKITDKNRKKKKLMDLF